jgi:hypothetical protein
MHSFLRIANGDDVVLDSAVDPLLLARLDNIEYTTNERSFHSLGIRSVASSIIVSLQNSLTQIYRAAGPTSKSHSPYT